MPHLSRLQLSAMLLVSKMLLSSKIPLHNMTALFSKNLCPLRYHYAASCHYAARYFCQQSRSPA